MSLKSFNTFILFLLVGLTNVYYSYKDHFSEERFLRKQLKGTETELTKVKMEKYLLNYHYKEFQQNVATVLPAAIKGQPYSYPIRNLASIVDDPIPMELESASEIFKKGEALYKKKEFEAATIEFKKIKNFYTQSVHLPESVFLLAECQYQMFSYEAAVDSIEFLITQYPEHILTGYALLRLGKIHEKHDRTDDAIMNYKLIGKRFQQKELRKQAKAMLEGMDL